MAHDEFINNVRTKVAEKYNLKTDAEIDAFFLGMGESAKDSQEALEKRDKLLRDTVAELCEVKRLLKAAVEDFNETKSYLSEPYSHLCDKWRYEDEALKLLGED